MERTNRPTRIETLIAIDWDNAGLDPQPITDFVGDALVSVNRRDRERFDGRTVPRWEIEFDANAIRDTEVQGVSYRAGFVSNIAPTTGNGGHN